MKWRTRDGQAIEIAEMTDSHLVNTIRYLRRNAEHIRTADALSAYTFADNTGGEMASDLALAAGNELMDSSDEDYLKSRRDFVEMLAEAERRKLEI